jgi:hypothetical protein
MTLTETTKQNLVAGSMMFALLAIPALGCWLAIITNNPWWLWLLLPLFAFMEAGLFFAIVACLGVSFYMGW